MKINYIDIHSHLGFEDYEQDLDEVIKRMEESGVATIAVGATFESSREAVRVANINKNIWACVGIHPTEKESFHESDFDELVENPKVVAIGECGLEFFKMTGDVEAEKTRQKKEFIKQIEFAIKYNKPLMLHVRDAYEDAYEILKKYEGKVRGNMHFFAGSLLWAKKFIDLGFTISFTGVITFARQYDEVIKNIPLDKIHAETDSPFVSPVPYRGKRNEPAYVVEVVKKIAEICGEDLETVRLQLLDNARKVFRLSI